MRKLIVKDLIGAVAVLALAATMGNLGQGKTTSTPNSVATTALQNNPSYMVMPTSQNLMVLMAANTTLVK